MVNGFLKHRVYSILIFLLITIKVQAGGNIPIMFIPFPSTLYVDWTGSTGNGLWNDPLNWVPNVVPNESQVARFNALCVGMNCNATLNSTVSVAGLLMDIGYSGTISQSTFAITVGSQGWQQYGGTFIGSSANKTIAGGEFRVASGNYTSTSGTTRIEAPSGSQATVFRQTGGTVNFLTGTLLFSISSPGCAAAEIYTIDPYLNLDVNNLRFAGGHESAANTCTWSISSGDTINANGNFEISRDLAAGSVAASGSLFVKGNLTYGTGTNGGSLSITLNGTGTQDISQSAGTTLHTSNLNVTKSSGSARMLTNLTLQSFRDVVVNSGIFDLMGNTLTLNRIWAYSGAHIRMYAAGDIVNSSSHQRFQGCTYEYYGSVSFGLVMSGNFTNNCHIIINKTSGFNVTLSTSLVVGGDLILQSGTLNSNGQSLSVIGNWVKNSGTFTPGTTTVNLAGTNQTISGDTTFYNLTKSATTAQTLTFAAGSTTTVTNNLTLMGTTSSSRLSLRSSTPASQWNINVPGTRILSFLDVQDSNNTHATSMDAGSTSINSGNNINWQFGGDPIEWTGLAGNNLWSDPGNWNPNSVPNSTQVATFNGVACTGLNCNVTVDSVVSVKGILMDTGYPGTISHGALAITIGTDGLNVRDGIFSGGSGNITITNGPVQFQGGTFNSSSGTMRIEAPSGTNANVLLVTGGIQNFSSGTLFFAIATGGCTNSSIYTIDLNTNLTVNNLRFAGGHASLANECTWTINSGDTLIANGNFDLARELAAGTIRTNGILHVAGNITYGAGTNGGNLSVRAIGGNNQNISQAASTSLPNGVFYVDKTANRITATSNLTFTYELRLIQGTFDKASITIAATTLYQSAGSTLRLCGGGISWSANLTTLDPGSFHDFYCGGTWNFGTGGHFRNLIFSGGATSMGNNNWIADDVTISAGSFNTNGYTINVNGNWTNNATYTASNGRVILSGGNQTISGNNTFYQLVKNVTATSTLTFAAGSTTNVTNALALNGSSTTSRLLLRSSSPGTQWNINVTGSRSLSYLDVQDSNNTHATAMAATATSVDSGNNVNWTFGATIINWTGLGGNNLWNNVNNWNPNTVPTTTHIARFSGTNCSGPNCNVSLNAVVNVAGLWMESDYTGTLTQTTSAITVGRESWFLNNGTFTGGTAAITVSGSRLEVSGGSFSNTTNTLRIEGAGGSSVPVLVHTGGTLNLNSGTLYFTQVSPGCISPSTYTIDLNTTLTVNNLRFAGGHGSLANTCTWQIAAGDTLTALGNFDMTRDYAAGSVAANGILNVNGNVTFGTGSGGGTLATTLTGTGNQNISQTTGTTLPTGALLVNKASGIATAASDITVPNGTIFGVTAGILERTNRNFNNMIFTMGAGSTFRDYGGLMTLWGSNISSTSNWDVCYTGSFNYNPGVTVGNFRICPPTTATLITNLWVSGNLTIEGTLNSSFYTINIAGNLTTTGTFNAGTGRVNLNGTGTQTITGNHSFYRFTKNPTSAPSTLIFQAGSTQTIQNDLILSGGHYSSRLTLRSTSPGTRWNIRSEGNRTLGYLDVQDSENIHPSTMDALDTSIDSGNNVNWNFNPLTAWKTVFLTSSLHTGSVSGSSGANSICQTRANSAGLIGTFRAWIASFDYDSPAITYNRSNLNYRLVGGVVVANDWAGLTSGTLLAPISRDEFGNIISSTEHRWTNVAANGTHISAAWSLTENCNSWYSSTATYLGRNGTAAVTDSTWTDSAATINCNVLGRLICVQQ